MERSQDKKRTTPSMTFAKIIEWNMLSNVYQNQVTLFFVKVSCCFIQRQEKDIRCILIILAGEKKGIRSHSKRRVSWSCFSAESHRSYHRAWLKLDAKVLPKFQNELLKHANSISFSLALFIAWYRNLSRHHGELWNISNFSFSTDWIADNVLLYLIR